MEELKKTNLDYLYYLGQGKDIEIIAQQMGKDIEVAQRVVNDPCSTSITERLLSLIRIAAANV